MKPKLIYAADLFCGAGGFSSGLMRVAREMGQDVQLVAVNHWPIAVDTHSVNHPGAQHYCEAIEGVDPRKAVPSGRLHLLMASPECTHHSNARGGKPMSDQSRATAWHILRWAEALYVENILIENVREFREWGPLGANGRPLKAKRGALYRQFLSSLRAMGYVVEDRLLTAADFGDATSRTRLFIQARRGGRKIVWPSPSHMKSDAMGLFPESLPYRTAREIIDWNLPSASIYNRKKPLALNTLRRIEAGLKKFCGIPFLIGAGGPVGQGHPQSVDNPLGTVLTDDHRALIQPFLVVFRNKMDAKSLDCPLPTMTTSGANFGLCEPFLMMMEHSTEASGHSRRCYPLDRPLNTVTSKDMFGLIEPFLVKFYGGSDACSLDEPLPTVTANYEHVGVCQPFLVKYHGGAQGAGRAHPLDEPMKTLDTSNRFGLVQPFLINYYGNGKPLSVEEPMDTIPTKDRFALISPELLDKGDCVAMLDVRFRMLQPHELAAAHSFPIDYHFAGSRDAKVKQIGNSVPVSTAAALCRALLEKAA